MSTPVHPGTARSPRSDGARAPHTRTRATLPRSHDAVTRALDAIAAAADLDALKAARLAHAGDRSPLALANRAIADLPKPDQAAAGRALGSRAGRSTTAIAEREAALVAERDARVLAEETVDVTLPVRPAAGRRPAPDLDGDGHRSRTCSSRWAGRSPRAPSSRPSGSTSTR